MNDDIKAQLDRIEAYAALSAKNILTLKDAALLTGLSADRLRHLASEREIPHYKQGKLYFRRDELERWMTANRRPCRAEIESQAELYTTTHNINN